MRSCELCNETSSAACARPYCPLRIRHETFARIAPLQDIQEYQGPAPAPFVGRYGYPNIHVGVLSTPIPSQGPDLLDAPRAWAARGYSIADVVAIRSSLINARFASNVKQPARLIRIAQEVSMAAQPPEVEVELEERPALALRTHHFHTLQGPAAPASRIALSSNPRVPTRIEHAVDDTDWKATEAAWHLYHGGIDENRISNLLSVGLLGLGANRKLVPTRWSITASDDMLGKKLAHEVSELPEAGLQAFEGSYLGNHYLILCFPGPWSFELFETMVEPNKHKPASEVQSWTDYEGIFGRKTYASNTVGGYYACRLSVLEGLSAIKRRGSILALRFVTEEYSIPLGVWVVREATRKAMQAQAIEFGNEGLMLEYALARAKTAFGVDAGGIMKGSKLLDQRRRQPRLDRFF